MSAAARKQTAPAPPSGASVEPAAAAQADPPAAWADAEDFLRHLDGERQLSPNTVVAYRKDLSDLAEFLTGHFAKLDWSWSEVDRLDLRSFMGSGQRRG